jgi:hypothetical protein
VDARQPVAKRQGTRVGWPPQSATVIYAFIPSYRWTSSASRDGRQPAIGRPPSCSLARKASKDRIANAGDADCRGDAAACSVVPCAGIRTRSDRSVTSAALTHCSWLSGISECRSPRWLSAWLPISERLAVGPLAGVRCRCCHRCCQPLSRAAARHDPSVCDATSSIPVLPSARRGRWRAAHAGAGGGR